MATYKINKQLKQVGDKTVYILSNPLENYDGNLVFEDILDGLTNNHGITKKFSYSTDGENWTTWEILSDDRIGAIEPVSMLFLKFSWEMTANLVGTAVTLVSISMDYVSKEAGYKTQEFELPGLKDVSLDYSHIAKDMSKIENDINTFINRTSPFKVKYWRTEPKANTADVILMEYALHKTVECKEMNVVVEGGELPIDEVEFKDWGTDWEDATVFIDPRYFEEIFGPKMKPRNEDYMLFVDYNRMYYVNSTKLKRGLGGMPAYWIIGLKTYEDNSSVEKSDEMQDEINNMITSPESLFGEEIKNEMIDATNMHQNVQKTISQDELRDFLDTKNVIVEEEILNNGSQLIKSYYDFSSIGKGEAAVKYLPKVELATKKALSLASWFNLKEIKTRTTFVIDSVEKQSYNEVEITTSYNAISLGVEEDGFVKIEESYYRILDVVDKNTFIVQCTNALSSGMECQVVDKFNFLELIDNQLSIDILEGKAVVVSYKEQQFTCNTTTVTSGVWYCLIVNLDNLNSLIGVSLLSLNPNGNLEGNYSTALKKEFNSSVAIPNDILVVAEQPLITASNILMTNIRIFKSSLDEEWQNKVMGVRVIQKPSIAFVIDDAQIIFNNRNLSRSHINGNIMK